MVSFSCEACGDVLTKKKLDPHRNQCRSASFTCLDCMIHFSGTDYRAHTSCISEAQKYQGQLYKEKDKRRGRVEKRTASNGHTDSSRAMVPRPRSAYVEDAPEGDEMNIVAVVDVPPRAPTPPPQPQSSPETVNVFDFLVSEETSNGTRGAVQASAPLEHTVHFANGDSHYPHYPNDRNGTSYEQDGYSYGNAPVEPSFDRYSSWHDLTDAQAQKSQAIMPPPPPYVTPGPRHSRTDKSDKPKSSDRSSDKKRKRQHVEDLDLSSAKRPSSRDAIMTDAPLHASSRETRILHSGLTGGLSKLITDPTTFANDRIDAGPTPISPLKRSKRADKVLKDDRRKSSYASYSIATSKASSSTKHTSSHQRHRSHSLERPTLPPPPPQQHQKLRKRRASSASSSEDGHRRPTLTRYKAIEYATAPPARPASVQPNATNQVVSYGSMSMTVSSSSTRAERFLAFVTKGPESERGCSVNKVLKRWHRERGGKGEGRDEEEDRDKDLWRSLRLRRNERGEIVVFV